MATIALIGYGELGSVLGGALAQVHDVRAWSRSRPGSLEEAVDGAALVVSVVPGAASEEVAERVLAAISADACFADLTAAPPEAKERAAARHEFYADGAVLGTVATSGHEVPIAAAGGGAERFRELVAPAGLRVEVLAGAEAGTAARLKLVRSVYMKGRDALVLETMLAARRLGIEEAVVRSIVGPGEQVPFADLSERVLRALAVHAGRRAQELESSAALLRELGVEPTMADAGAERLRRLAERGLRERFRGERPERGSDTLDALDQAD
jgi:3-hydroxyisobutyrate dehydrogenase-like beta-hydroxyacid dehydrogenase